ncbi:hypothetical protein [Vulcanisaeta souniana]|uniref:Uncharacterized protein n=1 Tax=Vulcanisaeta souniana JCM 11219 TaxID=1293586 RepID=A0A830E7D7_9CREN|nr:hypothetical protein [Vulcanisaeta souniana]BDR93432.1 hypothetical protein Vsou_25250 [Vulcanisaeta souniana JCM 11219]GGI77058.1 hypothetical protein GCM10007112_12350 [Vulcanisaeta souniana JCM 11219]
MPSKAIGMGMCPRCGRPGTVVIKAGNYVYIKHGNTWHYIGIIDKVNLNKILIKDGKTLEEIKKDKDNVYIYKNIKNAKSRKLIITGMALLIILGTLFYSIFFMTKYNIMNDKKDMMITLFSQCHLVKYNDNIYEFSCNNTTNIVNASVNYVYNFNLTKYNITDAYTTTK